MALMVHLFIYLLVYFGSGSQYTRVTPNSQSYLPMLPDCLDLRCVPKYEKLP